MEPILHLKIGWLWMLAGFLSGALMGPFFKRPDWLGGYGALPRRMVRLCHISFFGLGWLNLMFAFSLPFLDETSPGRLNIAGIGFVVGAVTMPLCCLLLARFPRWNPVALFTPPVASLLVAGSITFWEVITL